MPDKRIEEILDRVTEMEHALPGLRDRSPAAATHVVRELRALIAECSEERDRWQRVLDRAQTLANEPAEPGDAASDTSE